MTVKECMKCDVTFPNSDYGFCPHCGEKLNDGLDFPLEITYYMHDQITRNRLEEKGITENEYPEIYEMCRGFGYEHKMTYMVEEDGSYWLAEVDGRTFEDMS